MGLSAKWSDYSSRSNSYLFRAIPSQTRVILHIGSSDGALGKELKRADPNREVIGIEKQKTAGSGECSELDRVLVMDIETKDPPLEERSVDVVIIENLPERLRNPECVLSRLKKYLRPQGFILASIRNAQHHSVLGDLLAGDFDYRDNGLFDPSFLRFLTLSSAQKLFLDAGYSPDLFEVVKVPASESLFRSLEPIAQQMNLSKGRMRFELNAYQYLFRAYPLEDVKERNEPAITFVACVSDDRLLTNNLLASPDLRGASLHEVITIQNCPSAAAGLNHGLERAKNPLVVLVHQDVYLPRGWCSRFGNSWNRYLMNDDRTGVAGVYGVAGRGKTALRTGHVIDRIRYLREQPSLPAIVDSLDELLLALPSRSSLRFDPGLGFHLYGTDICLEAQKRGMKAVVLDAPVLHNSRGEGLPSDFGKSAAYLCQKWAGRLPLATPCVQIDAARQMAEW